MPPDAALPARLEAVLDVVYLVFNEGYAASAGDAHIRQSLCTEALRLAAVVAELMPDHPEALGLHALLLSHDARRAARVDAAGNLVLLEDQDRSRWDADAIEHATRLATRALTLGRPPGSLCPPGRDRRRARERPDRGRHALGPDRRVLLPPRGPDPDPVVELNRAVAIAMAGDIPGGLARIDALAAGPRPVPLLPRRPRRPAAPARGARAGGRGLHARANSPAAAPSERSCNGGSTRPADAAYGFVVESVNVSVRL